MLRKDNCKPRRETFEFWGIGASYIRDCTVVRQLLLRLLLRRPPPPVATTAASASAGAAAAIKPYLAKFTCSTNLEHLQEDGIDGRRNRCAAYI